MSDDKERIKDNLTKDYKIAVSDGSGEISEGDFNMDLPCHKEITMLTPDLEFCPVCGFYTPKK